MNLEKIKSPTDLKEFSIAQLPELCDELRAALLEKLSNHGGHIGPNLGMVEAIVALHYVFNSPIDKMVFDVSHQSYIHKMLTGRMNAFLNPQNYDDVSGYTNPEESEHDLFNIGHTSTSISLATGLAKGRDLTGGNENVIAIIGDGSLSGGEAFEGLDTAGTLNSNFIIIVNDNDMSIAENHGGIYANLRLLRETKGKAECNLFKAFGLDYCFVEDGNNVAALIEAFKKVKDINHPIVVHIVTEKGHGFAPAVKDKEEFHWGFPFDKETGECKLTFDGETYSSIMASMLLKRMKEDKRLVVVNAGTPGVIGFEPELRAEAGTQFVDVGIAEEQAAAMSSGLAKRGCRPVWGVGASFMQRTYDQISQDIAINSSPVTIAVFYTGIKALNDVTHLGLYDIAMISNIPNIVYLAPTCKAEFEAMLKWSINQEKYPVAIRVPSPAPIDLPIEVDDDYSSINSFKVVNKGSGIAIIAAGSMLAEALGALEILKSKNINPTVINPRFLTGIDEAMLSELTTMHDAVITVEDGILNGGFGEKIARFYGSDKDMLVECMGLPKQFYDRYNPNELCRQYGLTASGIADKVEQLSK
jgi:1-deoxy-D-xylulose-5-phosphate synthase